MELRDIDRGRSRRGEGVGNLGRSDNLGLNRLRCGNLRRDELGGRLLSEIEVPCGGQSIVWNKLRRAINEFMAGDDLKINEDKLLGPFFISPASLTPERFPEVFKGKVLLYLYEDAGKTKRSKMFDRGLNTYAKLCDAFDAEGVGIFGAGFDGRLVFDVDGQYVDGAEE